MTFKISRFGAVLAVLTLAACGSETVDDRAIHSNVTSLPSGAKSDVQGDDVVVGTELCDASLFSGRIGTELDDANLPQAANLRVFNVNDIVTRDYIPQRTNIVYDDANVITQVYCG